MYNPPKHHYDVISHYCVSKLAYFVEHDKGYQPSKFQCSRMSGSDFMEGVEPPAPVLQRDKKPSAYRVNVLNSCQIYPGQIFTLLLEDKHLIVV